MLVMHVAALSRTVAADVGRFAQSSASNLARCMVILLVPARVVQGGAIRPDSNCIAFVLLLTFSHGRDGRGLQDLVEDR